MWVIGFGRTLNLFHFLIEIEWQTGANLMKCQH